MDQVAALSSDLTGYYAVVGAIAPESPPLRLHGNSGPRCAARKLRAALTAHCGGRPSATQTAIIDQAAELKLRLAVMDADFIRTSHRSAHASRDYLAWSNSLVRLLRQLGLQGVAERAPTLAELLAQGAGRHAAQVLPGDADNANPPAAEPPSAPTEAARSIAA